MHKKYLAKKDTYITNKIIDSSKRATKANVGKASTLDLYKLYNENSISGESTPVELSKILVKFDTQAISSSLGAVDFSNSSFKAELELFDLSGAQISPIDYTLSIYPLSKSFDEGTGRDVANLTHLDTANWISSSYSNDSYVLWNSTGASKEGLLGSSDIDVISSGNIGNGIETLYVDKLISTRDSNLLVDVTKIFSASATGIMPDHGFLIKFSGSIETNEKSYFVKRFSSLQGANKHKKPTLHIKYDDHVVDDRNFARFNTDGELYLRNLSNGKKANILSGSVALSGSNCMLVKLDYQTNNITYLTASQTTLSGYPQTGLYNASFNIDGLNQYISASYLENKNITIHEKWTSLDENILFFTGSFDVKNNSAGFASIRQNKQVIIYNLKPKYKKGETPRANIFIEQFLKDEPTVRTPVAKKTEFQKYVYYQIKTVKEKLIVIPFSDYTRCNVDLSTVSFEIPIHSLPAGEAYSVDIKIVYNDIETIHQLKNTFIVEK